MTKAESNLGGDDGEEAAVPDRAAPEGTRTSRAGEPAKSVESMLKEFSSGAPCHRSRKRRGPGKYDQLWQLSMADPHTGLANQLLLLDRLTQALVRRRRHGGEVVVCHIGLDNLGEINLDLGLHHGQHRALRDVAAAHLGPEDRGHRGPRGGQ